MKKLKKLIIVFGVILTAVLVINTLLTLPKSFKASGELDFEVNTISVVSGFYQTPVVKIVSKNDKEKILQYLALGKYKREFDYPFIPKGGGEPIFKLGLKGNSPGEQTVVSCYGKRITINNTNYIADPDVTWKIAAHLMNRNFDRDADLGLIKIAHENINIISKKYGEQKPYVADIVPGITKKFGTKVKYDVHLQGKFKKGSQQAQNLYFSMREIYPVFWDIKGTDSNNEIVWKE